MTETPRRNCDQWVGRAASRPYLAVVHRLRCFGLERVPRTGPAIVAANHQSFFDPVVLGLALNRKVVYMAAGPYFRVPLLGSLMRLFGAVPVKDKRPGHRPLARLLRALEEGHLAGIFPEGHRTPDGLVGLPREGAASLALRTGAPVVPATISGAYAAWPRHRLLPRPAPIAVYFGEPFRAEGESSRQRRREITCELMLRIIEGLKHLGRPEIAAKSRRRLLEEYAG